MKAKKLSNKEKFAIVLEGLRGAGVADICARYGISQSHYYRLCKKLQREPSLSVWSKI